MGEKVEEKNNSKKKRIVRTRVWLALLSIALFIVLAYISFRGSHLETLGIGEKYLSILNKNQTVKHGIMAFIFVVVYLSVYITNKAIHKGLKQFFDDEKKVMPKLPNKTIALISGIICCLILSDGFIEKTMLFFHSALFGITDPILGKDIGYYMFKLPFIVAITKSFIVWMAILTIYIAVYYIITLNIFFNGINTESVKKSLLIKHVSWHLIAISVAVALLFILNTQGMLNDEFLTINDDNSTRLIGAGAMDIIVKKWGNILLAPITVISVFLATRAFKKQNTKRVVLYLCIVPIFLFAMFLTMIISRLIFINTNELDKQSKYIGYNINNTMKAYNIDLNVKQLSNNGSSSITIDDVSNNENIINNIPIVNNEITLKDLNISQTNVGYYSYNNTNLAIYNIDGKLSLVYITPREISNNEKAYNNKTYQYTHGYGVIISSATKISELGSINYIKNNFENDSSKIKITEPRIYFGLKTNDTVVTNSSNKVEFDYPSDDNQNLEYTYNGKAGLNLGLLDRLILGLHEKNINLAFSSNVNKDSKIITTRNIRERAKKIMPYLLYDENPYIVVSDNGKLMWVIDAYTISNEYPFSQSTSIRYENTTKEFNYIRNSVKVLIDCYDGTTTFYITDKTDPIAMAYNNIYKGLFEDENKIPQDIAKHFVYPKFLFNIQANILYNYHDVTPDVLYRGNDVWTRARYSSNVNATNESTEFDAYYIMTEDESTNSSKLGLVLPYTQSNKQNLKAYLVGTTDNKSNHKLTLYKYPESSNVLGPIQLDTQLVEDEKLSKEIERISVTGSKLIKTMFVIPVGEKLLYVEPIFQEELNDTTSVPVLKKVIVASGNKVAIGDSLNEAIEGLLSETAGNIKITNPDSRDELIQDIIEANNNLKKSTDAKDWEMIGKDLERLQSLIDKLERLENKQNNKQEGLLTKIFE